MSATCTGDHSPPLRQEKTGNLPSALPAVERQLDFSTGTLGLWSSNHFVIYYRDGRVPQPGIIILGRVTGDVSIFDRPGPVTVRVERINYNSPSITCRQTSCTLLDALFRLDACDLQG